MVLLFESNMSRKNPIQGKNMPKSKENVLDRPRSRLLELARARGASLAGLSELIGRNASYLQQFIRKGSPRKLEEQDRRRLAQFFGVDEGELGVAEEKSYDSYPDRKSVV